MLNYLAKKRYDWLHARNSFAELHRQPEIRKSLKLVMSMMIRYHQLIRMHWFLHGKPIHDYLWNSAADHLGHDVVLYGYGQQAVSNPLPYYHCHCPSSNCCFLNYTRSTQDGPHLAWLVFAFISVYSCTSGILIRHPQ